MQGAGRALVKIRRTRKQTAPRNLAARALRTPLFKARIEKKPDAYRRTKLRPRDIPTGEP